MSDITQHGFLSNNAGKEAHRELHRQERRLKRQSAYALARAAFTILLDAEVKKPNGETVRVPWQQIHDLRDAFDVWATDYFGDPNQATFLEDD